MIDYIHTDHLAKILANNERFVHWLSPLDMAQLESLIAQASYARQIEQGEGVLIGFKAGSAYQSNNLDWLRARFDDFVYIDRVIIGEGAQGRGFGRLLYDDFEDYARDSGISRMVCEVNTIPDNPGSHKFHLRLGFKPCGEMDMNDGAKQVRYYEKLL